MFPYKGLSLCLSYGFSSSTRDATVKKKPDPQMVGSTLLKQIVRPVT